MQVRLTAVFAALLYSTVLWEKAFAHGDHGHGHGGHGHGHGGHGHDHGFDELEDESVSTATTSSIAKPSFTVNIPDRQIAPERPSVLTWTLQPTVIKAPFYEQFTDDWESRWTVSRAKKVNDQTDAEEWAYVGQWAVEEPIVLKAIEGDKGLGIFTPMGISEHI